MTLQEIIDALNGAYKATHSAQAINAVAETLAATGMVTTDNLQAVVAGAVNPLKSFQAESDRRVVALQTENAQLKAAAAEKTPEGGSTQQQPQTPPNGAATKTTDPAPETVPEWAKPLLGYVEKLQTTELQQSLSKSLSDKMKAEKLNEVVYKPLIDSATLKDEASVDSFIANIKAIEQARTNAGLAGMSGTPAAGASGSGGTDLSSEEKAYLEKQKAK